MTDPSIQESRFPDSICFGCGPSNDSGLQLRSYVGDDGAVVASFDPDPVHQAYDGVLCGGIVGTLLDCHAAAAAVVALGAGDAEPVVTKEFTVRLRGPSPIAPLELSAMATEVGRRSATIRASLAHDGRPTAEFEGRFVYPSRPRRP